MNLSKINRIANQASAMNPSDRNLQEAVIGLCETLLEEKHIARINVVAERLFSFESFEDWQCLAVELFDKYNVTAQNTICVDSSGRLCFQGEHFSIAKEQNTFPITVYRRT